MGFLSGLFGGARRVDLWKRFERLRESHAGTMSTFCKVRDTRDGEIRGLKLIDAAKQAQVEAGWTEEQTDAWYAEATSDDYDHLLQTITAWHDMPDDDDWDEED